MKESLSEYVCTPKERINLKVWIQNIRKAPVINKTFFNDSVFIVTMKAWNENINWYSDEVVWFASKRPHLVVDKKYEIRTTIKDHKIYGGVEQTLITRTKVLKEIK